jgi:large subunit ribosomal protein L34e
MPQPHLRTRSRKRLKVKLSGGRNRTHYKKENTGIPSCLVCGQPLAGISHFTQAKIHKLNRSKKRIWRPYGGQVCHNCLKNSLKQAIRTL